MKYKHIRFNRIELLGYLVHIAVFAKGTAPPEGHWVIINPRVNPRVKLTPRVAGLLWNQLQEDLGSNKHLINLIQPCRVKIEHFFQGGGRIFMLLLENFEVSKI